MDLDLEGLEDASRLKRSSVITETSVSSPARYLTSPSDYNSYSESDFYYTMEVDTDKFSSGSAKFVYSTKIDPF